MSFSLSPKTTCLERSHVYALWVVFQDRFYCTHIKEIPTCTCTYWLNIQIGIYAAGMEGLLGKEVEPGQEDVSATAGLSLSILDVSLRPISFFTGQAGLMSAVWNAPSEPISALQVIRQHLS